MRRPNADREEKRVTRGSDLIRTKTEQEQLDLNDPNQRGLLGSAEVTIIRVHHGGLDFEADFRRER